MLRLKWNYVDKVPVQPSGFMISGRVVHAAIEFMLKEKYAGRAIPSDKDLDDQFILAWNRELAEEEAKGLGINWDEDDGDNKDRMLRECRMLPPLAKRDLLPHMQSRFPPEYTIKEEIDTGDKKYGAFLMWGVIDHWDKGPSGIWDWKTTRKISANARKLDLKTTAYGWYDRRLHTVSQSPARKVFLVRSATLPKIDDESYVVTSVHMDFFEKAAIEVWKATRDGNYVPNISSFWCSPSFCNFWGPCRGGL